MRLIKLHYGIAYVPSKELSTADAMSCAPLKDLSVTDRKLQEDGYLFVNLVVSCLPITGICLEEIRKHQEKDEICYQIKQFCKLGWAERVKDRL